VDERRSKGHLFFTNSINNIKGSGPTFSGSGPIFLVAFGSVSLVPPILHPLDQDG
jgi:hypothetical protein